jgi:hypothetical protein
MTTAAKRDVGIGIRTNMLVPGVFAWLVTVGIPAAERGVSIWARIVSLLVLGPLIAGPFVAARQPRLGSAIGVYGTMGLALVSWISLGPAVGVLHLDPVRSAIGSVGWVLFAFGWGSVRDTRAIPEDDPRAILGPQLSPRMSLPFGATVVLAFGILAATLPVFVAWRVARPSHALLAHASAILAAIGLVSSASKIASERQNWRPEPVPTTRFARAVRPLTLLAVVLILRLIWTLLR